MSLLQDAKTLVQAHYADLTTATADTVTDIIAKRTTSDAVWRGVHPFNLQTGPAGAGVFWQPFLRAMSAVQRREDIFFAGENEIDGRETVWTGSMGHLMGLFDAPFLNIPATGKMVLLRYAEFNKVENGQITETAFFCDILHLMRQAGIIRFPDQTAAFLVQPGPRTHDGLLMQPHDPAEGIKTLAVINRMATAITDANKDLTDHDPHAEMARNWTEDMTWFGPEGIGATYTIDRYIAQHQAPFRTLMSDRTFNGHLCRIAEGNYGGFFGWPNLTITNDGGYMGLPPNTIRADMRVIDMYRRDGDKLAENWIFIDMLHFMKMQGVDVLAELEQ